LKLMVAISLACIAMSVLLVYMTGEITSWLQADLVSRIENLALTIGAGVLVFAIVAVLSGLRKHDLLRGAR